MGKWLRRFGLALLCSLLAGFALGTCLRREVERPIEYIGRSDRLAPALPLHVGHAGAAVLDAGRDEEQVREAVQVAQRQG